MERFIVSRKANHVTKENSILTEDDTNPFLQGNINEDDVAEATPGFLMIDSDQEGDEDIDI